MKNKKTENYLLKKPMRNEKYKWTSDEKGIVTLEIENKGFFNKLCQKFFKKPPVSYVHLDEMGSFVWPIIDGKMDIVRIGEIVDEHFGEKAYPLYERLAKYFQILESYGFVSFNN